MLPLNAQDAQKGRSSSPPTISPMRGRKEGRKEEADVEKSMLTTTTQTLPLSLTHSLTHSPLCVDCKDRATQAPLLLLLLAPLHKVFPTR